MANPLGKISSSLAVKRARSQDSRRSQNASPTLPPIAKAPKTEEQDADAGVPAFLRQSKTDVYTKFQDLEWQQQLRLAEGRADSSSRWARDLTPQVNLRNRYLSLQPWANSRIHLKVAEGKLDYINASPISLTSAARETTYIVTQGPLQTGLNHFWQMVWHETANVAVIVMLTQTAEAGREKCFQYFPLDEAAQKFQFEATEDDEESSPEGTIQLQETVYNEDARSTVRKLIMTVGEEKKIVWHLLFSGWPDFAIPEADDRTALLELLKLSTLKNECASSPRIIHCSAGVGRSGTFIALEFLLAQLEAGAVSRASEKEDIVYDVVNRLREQRMTMVQSDIQYHFLYEVLREQFEQWQIKQASGDKAPAEGLHQVADSVTSALLHVTGSENCHEGSKTPDIPESS
ncbi:MAG: hypothetical protein Q9195_003397 [Heterodermia aff. obscurata]